ncbi:MAG: hypothetical protein AABW65_00225 [Nanoarchaeota archaeon]
MEYQSIFHERMVMPRDSYFQGNNLSPEHRAMISDKNDRWKVAFIDNIPYYVQKEIGYAFGVSDEESRKHYATMCSVWLHGEKYFLGEHLKREPTPLEIVNDVERFHIGERFRLFYILQFPEKMKIYPDVSSERRLAARGFLSRAKEISGGQYNNFFPDNDERIAA